MYIYIYILCRGVASLCPTWPRANCVSSLTSGEAKSSGTQVPGAEGVRRDGGVHGEPNTSHVGLDLAFQLLNST